MSSDIYGRSVLPVSFSVYCIKTDCGRQPSERNAVMNNILCYFRTRWCLILKGIFLYALIPALCLWLFPQPVGSAVRGSDSSAFLILLATLAAVVLNWLIYIMIQKKHPSLLVFAHGVLCLLLMVLIEYSALPASGTLASTLSVIAGCLTLVYLFLLSFWLAAHRSRTAHVFAVGLWIIIGLIAFFMLCQVLRDFEIRQVTRDTWITIVILTALVPAAFVKKILSARRRAFSHRRTSALTSGRIVQLIGETHLDRDDDQVTKYHARVEYTVDDVPYETRADIYKITMRRFGKEAFVGREIPVHYNPDYPSEAFVNRIDRHFFDDLTEDKQEK